MTFNEFLVKYNGKFVEVAGSPGAENQCVDLANAYIRDVYGLPIIEWTNAKDFPSKAGPAYDYILNTPSGIPKEGDLVIWGGNQYGHIAIFVEGNADTFRSFDQNWPLGSNSHIQNHNYDSPLPVIGWLRKKVLQDTACQVELDKCRVDRDKNWNMFTAVCEALGVGANVEAAVAEAKKLVGNDDALVQKDKQLQEAQVQIDDLKVKLQNVTVSHDALQNSYDALQGQLIEDKGIIQDLREDIATLEKQITMPVYKGWKKALIDLINKL